MMIQDRYAKLIYSDGVASTSHLYDVIRNPEYCDKKKQWFMECYKYLVASIYLSVASQTVGEDGDVDEGDQKCRSMGNKAVKKLEENKANQKVKDIQKSVAQMANTVARIEEGYACSLRGQGKHFRAKGGIETSQVGLGDGYGAVRICNRRKWV